MNDPRHILITGGSSGIGRALALAYAADGVVLYLSGRDAARLADTAEACRARGAQAHTALVEVSDRAAMAQWIGAADAAHPLDLVVANAGISGGTAGRADGEPLAQARRIFAVNLDGVLNTLEPVLPAMIARGRGQIAIVSSLSGYRGWPGAPAYSASKGAVRFYGEALRGALKRTGVRVSVILPGFVESRITAVNDFPMPFFLRADDAAARIKRGLARDKGRIAFPAPTHFIAWLIGALPDPLAQYIQCRMPDKS